MSEKGLGHNILHGAATWARNVGGLRVCAGAAAHMVWPWQQRIFGMSLIPAILALCLGWPPGDVGPWAQQGNVLDRNG